MLARRISRLLQQCVRGQALSNGINNAPRMHNATAPLLTQEVLRKELHSLHSCRLKGTLWPAAARHALASCKAPCPSTGGQRRLFNSLHRSRRPLLPHISEEKALYGLMAANVAVFLAWRGDPHFMQRHFMTSWDAVRAGRLHTLVTAAFSQVNTWHLFSNLLGLYFFGRNVAYHLGGHGLILLYLAAGVFGNLVYVTGQAWQERSLSARLRKSGWYGSGLIARQPSALGASGAVSGIVTFEILMMPFATVLIYGILPMPAWLLGALFLAQDINGALGHGQSNIGYTVHLGGAAVGALTWWGVRRGRIPTQWRRW